MQLLLLLALQAAPGSAAVSALAVRGHGRHLRFDTGGLPALSHDGQNLAIAEPEPGGESDFFGLALLLVDREGLILRTLPLVSVAEMAHLEGSRGRLDTLVADRVRNANGVLAEGGFRALTRIRLPGRATAPCLSQDAACNPSFEVSAGELVIAERNHEVSVRRAGTVVGHLALLPVRDRNRDCERHRPYVTAMALAADAHRLVLSVEYDRRPDVCEDPRGPYFRVLPLTAP
jgi:hypothetical protein